MNLGYTAINRHTGMRIEFFTPDPQNWIVDHLDVSYEWIYKANGKFKHELQSEFIVGEIVKYKEPGVGEDEYRFIVKEIHEAGQQNEKIRIELICPDYLKPQWVHFSDQYIKA